MRFASIFFVLTTLLTLHSAYSENRFTREAFNFAGVRSQEIEFTNTLNSTDNETQWICPAKDEVIGKIRKIRTVKSNAASVVNVEEAGEAANAPADHAAGCIHIEATLPPAQRICSDEPAPSFFSPLKTRVVCSSPIPTVLVIELTYEVKDIVLPSRVQPAP